jgi:hypothetical protein
VRGRNAVARGRVARANEAIDNRELPTANLQLFEVRVATKNHGRGSRGRGDDPG